MASKEYASILLTRHILEYIVPDKLSNDNH